MNERREETAVKIINPIYDKAFKYLMENDKFARKVLSVILEREVEELSFQPQEMVLPDNMHRLMLFRLDFKAVIREPDGSMSTVLIELQKSKYSTDIYRFRNYLGANYRSTLEKQDGVEEAPPVYRSGYPLIAIYILGYNLEDLPYMAVTVNRDVINSVSKEKIQSKCFFIEYLTHEAHIIQIRRLPAVRQTRLEQFFSLFDQSATTDENYVLDIPEVPEEFAGMARYLQGPLLDSKFRRMIDIEEEITIIFADQQEEWRRKLEESELIKNEALQQVDDAKIVIGELTRKSSETLQRETEAKIQAEVARQREEEARLKAEEARKTANEARQKELQAKKLADEQEIKMKSLAIKLAQSMRMQGASDEEIYKETGIELTDSNTSPD